MNLGDAVKITDEQLRDAFLSVIGTRQSVLVRQGQESSSQFSALLPRCHFAIPEDQYIRAAEAAGLNYQKEDIYSFSLWRKDASRPEVPEVKYTPGIGLHLASESPPQPTEQTSAAVPAESIAAIALEARAYQEALRTRGLACSTTEAVKAVKRRQSGKAPNTPISIAAEAQKLLEEETKAGRSISYRTAVSRVTAGH
ncbi:MAG: hypothetical protein JXR49_17565 [Acidobacteria bacterium]|nr:hypothetical protein [Acidobacteriota bacterium]